MGTRILVIGPGFDLMASVKTAMDAQGLLVIDESFYDYHYGIEYRPGPDLKKSFENVVIHLPVEKEPIRLRAYVDLKKEFRARQEAHSKNWMQDKPVRKAVINFLKR